MQFYQYAFLLKASLGSISTVVDLPPATTDSAHSSVSTELLSTTSENTSDLKEKNSCSDIRTPYPVAFAHSAHPDIACPNYFRFYLEGLAFQSKQDGMTIAISTKGDELGIPLPTISEGKVMGFSENCSGWDYNPGVRIGLGFYLVHDLWDFDFTWTHLNITNYIHANASAPNSTLIPLWILGSNTSIVPNQFGPRSSAVWKAQYNTFDFCLQNSYYISRCIIFTPHFGIRSGYIDQHFSVDYGGGQSPIITMLEDTLGDFETDPVRTIHHGQNNFRGIGVRAGFASDWMWGNNWGFFYNLSLSMLAGKFQINQNMVVPPNEIDETPDGFDLSYNFYQTAPNLEMALGLTWNRYFNRNKYRINVKAAYEFIEWWNQFNMRKFFSGYEGYANSTAGRGNLTFNGFSLRLQLDI